MLLYKKLNKKLDYLGKDRKLQVYRAYQLALEAHSNQQRDSGEQYITHPLAVANMLADMRFDHQTIMAALLHDVLEDTSITKEEIATKFGSVITELVDGVTKLSRIEASGGIAEHQAENFRKMVLAMARDIRVIIIKLVDRLHNMQTLAAVSPFKRKRIAKETLDIYAPIAHRLGMHDIYTQLEDLAFSALYPRRYRVLEDSVNKLHGRHQRIITSLNNEITEALVKNSIKDHHITGRKKHLYSVYKKMIARNISLVNIMDIYGFRVIVQTIDDCYRALGVIHSLYKPIQEKFKDYIAVPKFNGYQSLHTVLFGPRGTPVEIQIRTQEMDQIAVGGIASHWAYKNGEDAVSTAQLMAESWISTILEAQNHSINSVEFFESVKVELYTDKVFVFTPKGTIMEMPRGSTAVDFAYAVHTDIGNSCVAVRINRAFLPLSTPLTNGQTVSIITAKEAEPDPNWLTFAITSRAKHCIRNYLRGKRKNKLIALGRQLLDNAFTEISFDQEKIHKETFAAFIKKSNLEDLDGLYEHIGLGNHPATLVAYQLINNNGDSGNTLEKNETKIMQITGSQGMAVSFASCCHPIPGDRIVGYLNNIYGVDVHTEDCVHLQKLCRRPERRLKIAWANDVVGDFHVALSIEVVSRIGAFAEVTQAIAKANSKIDSIHCDTNGGGYSMLNVSLLVKNRTHLQRVKRHISRVPAVIGVMRKTAEKG